MLGSRIDQFMFLKIVLGSPDAVATIEMLKYLYTC
jgi:hypothetical protein